MCDKIESHTRLKWITCTSSHSLVYKPAIDQSSIDNQLIVTFINVWTRKSTEPTNCEFIVSIYASKDNACIHSMYTVTNLSNNCLTLVYMLLELWIANYLRAADDKSFFISRSVRFDDEVGGISILYFEIRCTRKLLLPVSVCLCRWISNVKCVSKWGWLWSF